jgi:hypothetical protein
LQQTPSAQKFEPHWFAAVHVAPLGFSPLWQVPAASQYCAPAQGVVAIVSCAPGDRLTQLPTLPGTAHPWQVPAQALLQQMPSAQKFDPHWAAIWHGNPFGSLFMAQALAPLQYSISPSQGFVALRSCCPSPTGPHVPSAMGRAQVWQTPLQAVLQQ